VQAVSASLPERIDLTLPQPCRTEARAPGEVVVCARKGESPYRIKQAQVAKEQGLPAAEFQVANGVTASADTESAEIGGQRSNRAMVRLKIKF